MVRPLSCGPLLVLVLLGARTGTGQSPVPIQQLLHTSWGTKDGLPVGGVYRIQQTPDGYLWLSSSTGLFRFDGLRFTVVDSVTAPALASRNPGEFWPLLVDRDGTFWLARPDDGLVAYRDGEFTVVWHPDPSDSPVGRMTQDRRGVIWIMTGRERRLRQLERGGTLIPAGLPAGVPDTGLLGMVPDTGTGLWIGTRTQGLWHVSDGRARHFNPACGDSRTIRPLLQAQDGKVWVTCSGIQYLDGDRWERIELPGRGTLTQPTAAVEGPDGTVWMATRGRGLVRWNGRELEQFSEADGLSDGIVHGLLLDPNGAIWATTDGGLDRLRAAPFVTIGQRQGLPFDSPYSIHEDNDGSIWVTSYDERRTFHLDGGVIRREAGPIRQVNPTPAASLTSVIHGTSRAGGFWFNHDDRLYKYRNGAVLPLGGIPLPKGSIVLRAVEDRRGRLWVSTSSNGLYVGRADGRSLSHVAASGARSAVSGLTVDSTGRVWVGTSLPSRLLVFEDTVLVRQFDSASGLSAAIRTPVVESRDTVWANLADGNLLRVAGDRLSTVAIPRVQEQLRTASHALLIDRGFLWIASEAGILRLALADLHRAADGDPTPVPIRSFNELDGLKVAKMTTLNRFPAFKARDGRLWFSTPAGLAVVDPSTLIPNPEPPLPHIEEVVVAGRPIPRRGLLRIAPNPSRVEIYYTATRLIVPERATLEYRLDGADRDWVRGGKERMVSYASLRPRLYTFRVRAWNEDGVPGASEATLVFRVLPFWYQTWWFLAILLLLVASAGALVFYGIQRARAQAAAARMQARYEATLTERTRLARELHDTLLQGFTGITLQLQAVHHAMVDTPRESALVLGRVLTTADATLREARQMVWDMRAPELDRHDLAEALENAARQIVSDTPITLDFTVEGDRRRLDIGIETTALRIGREAIANAVKHAEPTTIGVSLAIENRRLRLSVLDNGRGCNANMVDEAVAGGHWGIRGMRERAHRAGGTLEISGGPGRGTLVLLHLPLDA